MVAGGPWRRQKLMCVSTSLAKDVLMSMLVWLPAACAQSRTPVPPPEQVGGGRWDDPGDGGPDMSPLLAFRGTYSPDGWTTSVDGAGPCATESSSSGQSGWLGVMCDQVRFVSRSTPFWASLVGFSRGDLPAPFGAGRKMRTVSVNPSHSEALILTNDENRPTAASPLCGCRPQAPSAPRVARWAR